MTDLLDRLAAKGVKFLGWVAPGRMVGRRGVDLVALAEDGLAELWSLQLPSQEKGSLLADEQTILWNKGGERGVLIVVAAIDGRQLYALEGERAIVSLRGLSQELPYALSPDRRWLAAGCQPRVT